MAHATAAEVARPGRGPAVTLHRHWSTRSPVRPQDECTGCRSDRLALESVSSLPPGSLPVPGQDLRGVQLAVQRAASGGGDAADGEMPGVALDVLSRSGHPLDAGTQAHLSAQLGHSFANVRVHDGSEAASASASVGALAYTVGNSMVFGRGQYQPGTAAGRRLIAHEAAHVVQQRSGRVASVSAPTVGAADSLLEREADRVADAVVADRPPSHGGAATSVAGAPGRAGPVHPVKHPGELAPVDRRPWSPSAAADGPGVVQRVEDESAPIGELSAGEPVAQAGGPVAAEEQAASGTVEDANLGLTAQRQVAAPSGPVVVQGLSREEEINLSLTSPGRAVLDPSRPSLSLYNFGIDRSQLKAFHVALLAEFSAFLRLEVPAPTRIQVIGHADPTGTGPHNRDAVGSTCGSRRHCPGGSGFGRPDVRRR